MKEFKVGDVVKFKDGHTFMNGASTAIISSVTEYEYRFNTDSFLDKKEAHNPDEDCYLVLAYEKETKTINMKNIKYTFLTGKNNFIDFNRIAYDMESNEHIRLVTKGIHRWVVFNPNIINKAEVLGMLTPSHTIDYIHIKIKEDKDISYWVNWTRKVIKAPWGKEKPIKEHLTTVQTLKV